MNLVQSEIHARLRHGLTQTELAREFGIAICTLNNILKGHREPSAKVLKLLGIKREIVYVLTDDHDIPEGIAARAPLPRRRATKRVHEAQAIKPADLAPVNAFTQNRPEARLTTERVLVAVKFKLNPRDAWAAFSRETIDLNDIDGSWLAYCERKGASQIETKAAQPIYAGLGNGDAIALKPVAERKDFRRPRALGELPALVVNDQPEVSV